MSGSENPIDRIAALQRIPRAQAEAYVKSTAKQLGSANDLGRVAAAVVNVLESGGSCKVKDVARVLKEGASVAPSTPAARRPPENTGSGEIPTLSPRAPAVEERHDTRLRFERWAKNPYCLANTIAAVHGISMAEVAISEGTKPTMGQSPFALARGQNFERGLFRDGAKRLIAELADKGVLHTVDAVFKDFRLRQGGGPYRTLLEAGAATVEFLRALADGSISGRRPILAAGTVVTVPGGVMLPRADLVIDALVIRRGAEIPELSVGEIKTYPDRGGYTEPAELAQGRAQAGVYVHGLDLVCRELKIDGRLRVSRIGFLVLSRPGFNVPSVRANEDLEYQAVRAERGFERLRKVAVAGVPSSEAGRLAAVINAETAYAEGCISFCDRAPTCHKKALDVGDPAVLGNDMSRFLGGIDLIRAIAILGGAKPRDEGERDLTRRMKESEGLGR